MTTYKFLAAGAVAPFSGFSWPSPTSDGGPGAWLDVPDGEGLVPCRAGLHLCRVDDLPYWLNEELFAVETEGLVLPGSSFVLSRRARLSRRMAAWDRVRARAFTEGCVWSARDLTTGALRREGNDALAARLSACQTLAAVERCAEPFQDAGDRSGRLVAYTADAARWAAGVAGQDWAAACATTALIAAHVAASSDPATGPPAAEAERARQARWLATRVLGAPSAN